MSRLFANSGASFDPRAPERVLSGRTMRVNWKEEIEAKELSLKSFGWLVN